MRIKLTKRQIKKLSPIVDGLELMACDGNPGGLLAQVFFSGAGDELIFEVLLVKNDIERKIQKLLNIPQGKEVL